MSRLLMVRLAALGCVLLATPVSRAQDDLRDVPRPVLAPAPTPRPTVRVVVKEKIVEVTKKPTTGMLSVVSEPGAAVSVIALQPDGSEGRQAAGEIISPDQRLAVFDTLPPGRYRVKAQRDGYRAKESDVQITPGNITSVTLDLEPITYDVELQLNVGAGEVWYIEADDRRRAADIGAAEPYWARNIVKTADGGKVVLPRLRAGRYDVDIRPSDYTYLPYKATYDVGEGKTKFPKVVLKRRVCENTFAEAWANLAQWSAPEGWRTAGGRLLTGTAGTALPRGEGFRCYADFQLTSDVRMASGEVVSFVLRAQDERNYYLLQLTGPTADEPSVLRGFVVRDGAAEQMQPPISVSGVAETIRPGAFFTVRIRAEEHEFKVWVRDARTGEELPLGALADAHRTFRLGGVGLAVRGGEQFEVARFHVCPPQKCPSE